jgi:hypothetical protein
LSSLVLGKGNVGLAGDDGACGAQQTKRARAGERTGKREKEKARAARTLPHSAISASASARRGDGDGDDDERGVMM